MPMVLDREGPGVSSGCGSVVEEVRRPRSSSVAGVSYSITNGGIYFVHEPFRSSSF